MILNPSDSGEFTDVNLSKSIGDIKVGQVAVCGEFLPKKSKDANRVNLIGEMKSL